MTESSQPGTNVTLFHLPVVLEKDEDGYFVYCPRLQGCYAQGDTYEEAIANIQDAIKLHLKTAPRTRRDYAKNASASDQASQRA